MTAVVELISNLNLTRRGDVEVDFRLRLAAPADQNNVTGRAGGQIECCRGTENLRCMEIRQQQHRWPAGETP